MVLKILPDHAYTVNGSFINQGYFTGNTTAAYNFICPPGSPVSKGPLCTDIPGISNIIYPISGIFPYNDYMGTNPDNTTWAYPQPDCAASPLTGRPICTTASDAGDLSSFLNTISGYLCIANNGVNVCSSGSQGGNPVARNQTGAAMTIDVMMGHGDYQTTTNGINSAIGYFG